MPANDEPQQKHKHRTSPATSPRAESEVSWHILGAGAMGRLMATKFTDAGLDVTLVTRPEPKPRRRVIPVERLHQGSSGTYRLPSEPANLPEPIQQLVVTTKSNQVVQALADLGSRIDAQTQILLLHNGMGVLEALTPAYSQTQLYPGVTTEGAYQDSAGRLVYAGQGTTQIGQQGRRHAPTWIQPLLKANLGFFWQAEIHQALWRKLLINCAINPLTALHNCTNGQLLEDPKLKASLDQVLAELAAVAAAVGHPGLANELPRLVAQVLEGTKANFASMQQDVQHQRATEIAYINGYLCEQARANGVSTPVNLALIRAVQQLESSYQRSGQPG